ncbi:hypothetical protein IG631_24115 [Alternaria alternata]|nr:hypothetical protein IG631_24115 [Alternaria alternata]
MRNLQSFLTTTYTIGGIAQSQGQCEVGACSGRLLGCRVFSKLLPMRRDFSVRKTPFAEIGDDAIRSFRSIDIFVVVEVIVMAACYQCAAGIDAGVACFVGVA